jgi:D-amino peptidase
MSEKAYDGVIFIGQHAKAGTKGAVLAHTQSFGVRRLTLNGLEVGEVGQVAAIAGQFDIPVIMLAGDEAACAEMLELQPTAVTVAVKRLAGKASTSSLSHAEAKRLIRQGAEKAVAHAREYAPWKLTGPVEMVIEYHPQPPLQPAARSVSYKGATVLEAYEAWLGPVGK